MDREILQESGLVADPQILGERFKLQSEILGKNRKSSLAFGRLGTPPPEPRGRKFFYYY